MTGAAGRARLPPMSAPQPYAGDRLVHDADSHAFELPGSILPWLDPGLRDRLPAEGHGAHLDVPALQAQHRDPGYRAQLAADVLAAKEWAAAGAFDKPDRSWALDLLGFASQLVFTTAHTNTLTPLEHGDDQELAYGYARAHNRLMIDFCSDDDRLLPVCFVPLSDLERVGPFTGETLDLGAAALMVSSACPPGHAHSHTGLDVVWAQAQEAGVPVIFHVGGGGQLLDPGYLDNGGPTVPDFQGGEGNFTSVSYMAIAGPPQQTLATMIFDGVLERFPDLRFGVIEQGATWLPGWLRTMDGAVAAFGRMEERLRALSLRPSEYVRRQVRVTPYPHEPVDWIIRESGPELCMFSSDYPHIEGGRDPMRRFDAALEGCRPQDVGAFYAGNFADLMGPVLQRISPREPAQA